MESSERVKSQTPSMIGPKFENVDNAKINNRMTYIKTKTNMHLCLEEEEEQFPDL